MGKAENHLKKPVTARMDVKGRLTLPQSIRKALGAKPGDTFYLRPEGDSVRIVKGINPFDGLAEHALKEFEEGKTITLEEFAEREGISLED